MASPEELRLEQQTRALKLKEDALSRQAQLQLRTETRLTQNQEEVAQKERANRLKAQELSKREQKLEQDRGLIKKESESLTSRLQDLEAKKKNTSLFLLPVLLIVCVIGGYLAFDYMDQQERQYNQIALASKNIDKLANILNMTQEEMLDKSTALHNKKAELDKTKTMLIGLKTTSDQLQDEITKLKSNQLTPETEQSVLSDSAQTLASQLLDLKTQLDDNYLTLDVNEAFIDYQEHDIETFKEALATYKKQLEQKEGSLSEHKIKQTLLEKHLVSSKEQNNKLSSQLSEMNISLKEIQSQLKETMVENKELIKENSNLGNELAKLKTP